jgi:hypothetical protein
MPLSSITADIAFSDGPIAALPLTHGVLRENLKLAESARAMQFSYGRRIPQNGR